LTPADNYDPQVIIMGGNSPATNTTEIIDMGASAPAWQSGPDMSQPRIEMNAVILPDGRVLAVGGSVNDEDISTASLNADLLGPDPNNIGKYIFFVSRCERLCAFVSFGSFASSRRDSMVGRWQSVARHLRPADGDLSAHPDLTGSYGGNASVLAGIGHAAVSEKQHAALRSTMIVSQVQGSARNETMAQESWPSAAGWSTRSPGYSN
jgi:hypothetical protein